MNTAILSSVVGGSAVVIAALLGITFSRIFEALKSISNHLGVLTRAIGGLEGRFDGLEKRFGGLEGRFDGLEKRFGGLERRFGGVEKRFGGLERRFGGLESSLTADTRDLEIRLIDKFTSHLKEHGERLARIEAKLDINPPAEAA